LSYDFLGTHNQSQLARFSTFANAQLQDIFGGTDPNVSGRVGHLTAELIRVGSIVFQYDNSGNPVSYTASPPTSYIGRLLSCYEVLGGNPLFDLNIRSSAQAVFVLPANETSSPQLLSNGETLGSPGLADTPSANLMQTARAWLPDVLKYKRDYLERKIRRMVDYSEQLASEIANLTTTLGADTQPGSLANTLNQLQQLMADPNYRATYADGGNDPLGKKTYTPFAAYEGGPNRIPVTYYQRGQGGVVAPGQGYIPTPDTASAAVTAANTTPTSAGAANPSPTPGSGTA
jgi:hypothetical protein